MISPARLALVAASLALTASCTTFTDDDLAARVGDAELTTADLADLLRETAGADVERAPALDASQIVNDWVLDQVLRADLDAAGTRVPPPAASLTLETLTASINESFGVWQTTAPQPVDADRVQALYERGPVDSNIVCPAHILVETEAEATAALDRLDAGEEFATLARELSFDPGTAEAGGALNCDVTGNFVNSVVPEFARAAIDAPIGEPVGPIATQFGFHVIVLRPFATLADDELEPLLSVPGIRFDLAATDVDVYVNPRFGAFDGARGVTPLG